MEEKRTLDELIAIYAFEPNLRDVFVEGHTDKCFIEWFLARKRPQTASVYSIDLIAIPDEILTKHGLKKGSKRSSVIALSCELAARHPNDLHVICVADRDFEDYLPSAKDNPYLAFTDTNALDLYALTLPTLEKFTLVALGGFPLSSTDLIKILASILERVYALRLANELLGWGMEWLPFSGYVEVKHGEATFDEKGFTRAYLQKNSRWNDKALFDTTLNRATQMLSRDVARRIRGHDLGDLLLRLLRRLRKDRKYGNPTTLEGCLMTSIEWANLESLPLFQRLLSIAGTS